MKIQNKQRDEIIKILNDANIDKNYYSYRVVDRNIDKDYRDRSFKIIFNFGQKEIKQTFDFFFTNETNNADDFDQFFSVKNTLYKPDNDKYKERRIDSDFISFEELKKELKNWLEKDVKEYIEQQINEEINEKWNIENIKSLIGKYENRKIEFKSAGWFIEKDPKRQFQFKDIITSFANTDGGDIIFGIKEENSKGICEDLFEETIFKKDQLSDWIENIKPTPKCTINTVKFPNNKIAIVVSVEKGNTCYWSIDKENKKTFWKRSEKGKEEMTHKEVEDLFFEKQTQKIIGIVSKSLINKK